MSDQGTDLSAPVPLEESQFSFPSSQTDSVEVQPSTSSSLPALSEQSSLPSTSASSSSSSAAPNSNAVSESSSASASSAPASSSLLSQQHSAWVSLGEATGFTSGANDENSSTATAKPTLRKREPTAASFEASSKHFKIGMAYDKNSKHRRTMEDAHGYFLQFGEKEDQGFFFILDGHGGKAAAEYCATALPTNMLEALGQPEWTEEQVFTKAFEKTDTQLEHENISSGATVIACLVRTEIDTHSNESNRFVISANAGDARAVLSRNGQALRLSKDHKASDDDERERIEAGGGMVIGGRVNGILAIARALGDVSMKEHIVSTPFVQKVKLANDDRFVVLACDGIWDVMSDQEVVDLVSQYSDAKEAAEMVIKTCLKEGSTDNVSCMVVMLGPNFDVATPLVVDEVSN